MIKKTLLLTSAACYIISCDIREEHSDKELIEMGKSELEGEREIDWNQFEQDLNFVELGEDLPLGFGVFPVKEYNSSGNGNIEKYIELGEKKYIQQSVFVYQGSYNKEFFSRESDSIQELVYFTILYRTDIQNPNNEIMATTRNHPIYLGQGIIKNDSLPDIKWIAYQKESGQNDFALINMKYFDLSKGRIIVVHSKSNGSLRFKQLSVNPTSLSELEQLVNSEGKKWHDNFESK